MAYQFLHWLFGWDYVAWNKSNVVHGVSRVWKDKNDRVFYWCYKLTKVCDEIKEPDQVVWLTCAPDKYLKND